MSLDRILGETFMKALNLLLVLAVIGLSFTSTSLLANDNSKLLAAYQADQKARSDENLKNGNFPQYRDEMARRLLVFEELVNGRILTAADFVHAAVILQHTNLERVGEKLVSMGNENHLLAYYLAKRAAELNHPDGRWLMAASYNRYIENSGLSLESYGVAYSDGELKAANKGLSNVDRTTKGLPPLPAIAYERDE